MDYDTLTRILLSVWTTGCYMYIGNSNKKNSWQDLTISILLVLKSFIKNQLIVKFS